MSGHTTAGTAHSREGVVGLEAGTTLQALELGESMVGDSYRTNHSGVDKHGVVMSRASDSFEEG